MNQKKRHFSEAFFAESKNCSYFPKIFPGFQDFLTETNYYAGGKRTNPIKDKTVFIVNTFRIGLVLKYFVFKNALPVK